MILFPKKNTAEGFILIHENVQTPQYAVNKFLTYFFLSLSKKFFLAFLFLFLISAYGTSVLAQTGTASATYTFGDIDTDSNFRTVGDNSSCPGLLTVTIPVGAIITGVDVSYMMTSRNGGWASEQRSQLRCVSAGGTSESSVYSGSGNYEVTYPYSRTGLTIANGVTGGGAIAFELHAGRTWSDWLHSGCSTYNNYVTNNKWTITVHYTLGLTVSPITLTGFTYAEDLGPSAVQSFAVSGSGLTGNVNLNVDNTYYEISTTSGLGYGSSLTLSSSGGTLTSTNIYVRLKTGLAVNTYNNQTITVSTAGFTSQAVTCSGYVTANPVVSDMFWYKADVGVAGTTSVTSWTDQSTNTNNANNTGAVSLVDNSINFNPYLSFSNVNRQFITSKSTVPLRFLVVTKPSNTNNDLAGLIGSGADKGIRLGDGVVGTSNAGGSWKGDNNADDWSSGGTSRINALNSYTNNYQWHIVNQSRGAALASSQYYLGGYYNGRPYTGYIAEVVAYSSKTLPADLIAESYLAIKYGITLGNTGSPVNYFNPLGATIWTGNATYQNDIAGLGRNTMLGLNQKVSSSINVSSGSARVVMATTEDFASSNLSSSRTSLIDEQYLIWGRNTGTVNSWTTITTYTSRVNRIWQIQNTNNVDSVCFQIDLANFAPLASGTGEIYALLVSSAANFSSNLTVYPLVNTSGSLYVTKAKFPAGLNYFTIGKVRNLWMGATSSTDWGLKSNWTANTVPLTGEDVIFATTTNYGTAAINDLVLDKNRTVGNLINNTSNKLIIPVGKTLIVNETLTSGSDPNLIQIQADATSVNGSLIFKKPSVNANVYATVQMYTKGFKGSEVSWTDDISSSPTLGSVYTSYYRWQYFGIPVQSLTASPTFDGSWVREYREPQNDVNKYYQKWTQLANSSPMTPFTGYEITQDAPKLVGIQGKLVTGDKILNLTVSGGYGSGYNIFANPYTAAIDISKLSFSSTSALQNTVYLYNTGTFADWGNQGGPGTGTNPGSFVAIPFNTSGVTGPNIPSMQGFMLIATSPCTMTINYSDLANDLVANSHAQYAKRALSPSGKLSYMKVEVAGENGYDYGWLFDEEGTSHAYDNGWDGYKLRTSLGTSLSFDEDFGQLQVNTVDKIEDVYLSFAPGETDTQFSLRLTSNNILQNYSDLHLVDLVSGTSTKITSPKFEYSFTATPSNVATKRFLITGVKLKTQKDSSSFTVLSVDNSVWVGNSGANACTVYLYDTMGRLITRQTCAAESSITIPRILPSGAYVVNVVGEDGSRLTKKILLGLN